MVLPFSVSGQLFSVLEAVQCYHLNQREELLRGSCAPTAMLWGDACRMYSGFNVGTRKLSKSIFLPLF